MDPLVIALAVFVTTIGGALAGLVLHVKLPDHHLDSDSRDIVKLVIGLIATMAALVLGLLIASAQSTYQTQNANLQQISASVAELDHLLALYGQDASGSRRLLRQVVIVEHDRIWGKHGVRVENLKLADDHLLVDDLFGSLANLSPTTNGQRFIHEQALRLAGLIEHIRTLAFEQAGNSVSFPFLIVLTFWLGTLFMGFGLLARFHATVAAALLIGSLSVSAAIFLILELGNPYTGLIHLSDEPLRGVIATIGR